MKYAYLAMAAAVATAFVASNVSADTLNRQVVVHNITDTTVERLYITNSDYSDWLRDTLRPDQVMYSDQEINYNVDDGTGHCLYDFKAVFKGGAVREGYQLNVCTARHIDITASGIVVAY